MSGINIKPRLFLGHTIRIIAAIAILYTLITQDDYLFFPTLLATLFAVAFVWRYLADSSHNAFGRWLTLYIIFFFYFAFQIYQHSTDTVLINIHHLVHKTVLLIFTILVLLAPTYHSGFIRPRSKTTKQHTTLK
ncbi:MAG: hypothetical protein P1U42_11825 [Phycisphaerales bacterium]|nr:hypothetical protein [Phycisphaerales bacterium]